MARIENSNTDQVSTNGDIVVDAIAGGSISVPDSAFVTGSQIIRDGQDLKLETPNGQTVTIENYFNADPAPVITCSDGQSLTPDLVQSFVQHQQTYAQSNDTLTDESPVGTITEISGSATVTHVDGITEIATIGTPIYEGDIVETNSEGALNIEFVDNTHFAISNNARLAVDEYVFDPSTESGTSDFSVLRGLFVFTSGLIGRDDPDDVAIDTPMGSIGIRGTVIAGNVDTGEITVLEGAIVLRGINGGEVTLAEQFETAKFNPSESNVDYMGTQTPEDFAAEYNPIKAVSPYTFIANNSEPITTPEETPPTEAPEDIQTLETIEDSAPPPPESKTLEEGVKLQPLPDNGEPRHDGTNLTLETTETELVFKQLNDAGFDKALNLEPDSTLAVNTIKPQQQTVGEATLNSDPALTLSNPTDTDIQPPPPAHLAELLYNFSISNISGQIGTLTASGSDLLIATFRAVVLNTDFNSYNFNFVFNNPDNTLFDVVRTGEFTLEVRLKSGQTLTNDIYNIKLGASLNGNQFMGFDFAVFDPTVATPPAYIDLGALMAAGVNADGRFVSGSSGERLGDSVALAGDINGDGRPDLIIADAINGSGGAATIYNWNGSVLGSTPIANPGTNASVSGAGDFDGDGQADYIWGAPNAFAGSTGAGGIVSSSIFVNMTGADNNDYFGSSVAGLGDINGDGLSDVLFGAMGEDNSGTNEGSAFVIFGRNTNIVSLDIDAMGGTQGFEIGGNASGDQFGSSASAAGDLDNDGVADFAVASVGNASVSVFFGDPTIAGVQASEKTITGFAVDYGAPTPNIPLAYLGDVNRDGIGDLLAMSTASGGTAHIFSGAALAAAGATINVSSAYSTITPSGSYQLIGGGSAGDFNGDGLADTALAFRNGDQAEIFIIDGEALTANMTMTQLLDSSTATRLHFDLNDAGLADPVNDIFTFEISTAGDLNGDGFDDIVIGTPYANGGDGGFFTIYGSPEDDDLDTANPDMHASGYNAPANTVASSNNDSLVGDAGTNILSNLNGSIFSNISFRGGAGNDYINLTGDNARHIDGGADVDVLALFGSGTNIDFAAMGSESLSNIESIEMHDAGQSITLGLDDIFRLMQESQATLILDASRKILKIGDQSGGATSLTIEENGTGFSLGAANTTYNDGSTTYDAYYFNDGYALLIDQNVDTVNIV